MWKGDTGPRGGETSARPLVVLEAHQVAELVRGAVAEALAAQDPDRPAGALLDGKQLMKALVMSRSTLGRLKRQGLPRVKVLDADRFDLDECVAWLRARKTEKQ